MRCRSKAAGHVLQHCTSLPPATAPERPEALPCAPLARPRPPPPGLSERSTPGAPNPSPPDCLNESE